MVLIGKGSLPVIIDGLPIPEFYGTECGKLLNDHIIIVRLRDHTQPLDEDSFTPSPMRKAVDI